MRELPAHLRVAAFAEPKTYEGYVRFSNGSGARDNDKKPDLRGLAIKLLGVPGKKLIPGMEKETTQDLLFINASALAFRTVDEFVFFMQASTSQALLPLRLFGHFGFGTFAFLKRLIAAARPVPSLATETYFSVAPIRLRRLRGAACLSFRRSATRPPTRRTTSAARSSRASRRAPLVGAPRSALRERRQDADRGHVRRVA